MESEKYLEGQSMQRPPLFESDGFIYWKNRFETYVKSKDLDLWHVITDGDFPPIQFNPETKKDEIVSFHKQNDDLKKKLAKNNEAKMVDSKNLLERVSSCTSLFSLPEYHIEFQVNTSLIRKESHKSPTTVLFYVDTGRISIRHYEILKSITLNVLARSDDNA
ncbi:hypothetical protein Tco_0409575 [Tanacetum coccineum]